MVHHLLTSTPEGRTCTLGVGPVNSGPDPCTASWTCALWDGPLGLKLELWPAATFQATRVWPCLTSVATPVRLFDPWRGPHLGPRGPPSLTSTPEGRTCALEVTPCEPWARPVNCKLYLWTARRRGLHLLHLPAEPVSCH